MPRALAVEPQQVVLANGHADAVGTVVTVHDNRDASHAGRKIDFVFDGGSLDRPIGESLVTPSWCRGRFRGCVRGLFPVQTIVHNSMGRHICRGAPTLGESL